MALTSTPSIDQLKRAIAIQEKIAELQTQLSAILGGTAPTRGRKPASAVAAAAADFSESSDEPKTKGKKKKKRTMSPEAREKIAAAQRKRWAKQKKAA